MITPMKKVFLLVMDKNKQEALEQVRDLGVIHLEKKSVSSQALTKLTNRYAQIENAWGVLYSFHNKKTAKAEPPCFEGDIASHVIALSERRKKLQAYMLNNHSEKARFGRWGEFDPQDIQYLADHGVNIYLYEISFDTYKDNFGNIPFVVLAKDNRQKCVRIAAFEKIPNEDHWTMPDQPLSVVHARDARRKSELAKIEAELTSLSPLRKRLENEKKHLMADIEFETARASMELIDENKTNHETDLSVSWFSGYVPAHDVRLLEQAASENGWALCATDPAEDDFNVPTKLKNNRFTSLVYPIMNFLDLSPGYRETDISSWFLVFLAIFFGIIFGDAAYGAILLLISLIFMAKSAKKGIPLFTKFLFLMSTSCFIWGALTGAWFGLDIAKIPQFLQNITLPFITNASSESGWITSYNESNLWISSGIATAHATAEAHTGAVEANLKLFCFSLALVHLGLAHIKRMLRNIKSLKVLAELGHLAMLVGMYFVILSMMVYNTGFEGVKSWQLLLLAGGFILVFIFANYKNNLLKSITSSCTNFISLLLTITGAFSDIMSYIRLWAMAIAGAAIASTINSFAEPMLGNLIFFVFGVLLFVFGHGFNMVLNAMSFLVHGVRLNTLEFSSRVGLEWSGFAYKPFARRSQ
ncbi:MAG: V-type ATP synthase subunit I [Dehalococcoidia bacterium]|nr:V-type ATP synthase subunit I [Dehalococcoidia bacterium]